VRIGFNTLVLGGEPWTIDDGTFATIKAAGYDGVELPVFSGDAKTYAAIGRRLDAIGLARTFVTIIPDETCNPLSEDAATRRRAVDRLAWALDCGHALGATVMAGPWHSPLGVFTGDGPSDLELGRLAEVHRAAAERAGEAGIALSLEALNRFECYVLNTMDQSARHCAAVDHPAFTFMYDTFHANIEERDPAAAYRAHARAITHIHISENDRGIPGRGHIDFAPLFAALRETGYDGWITVEAFGRTVPALAAATRVWRDLFPDLDTLFAESIALIRREWDAAAPEGAA